MRPRRLDHVALRVPGRMALAERLRAELDLHVLEHDDTHTRLVPPSGGRAGGASLVLLDVDGEDEGAPATPHTRLVSVILAERDSERPPLITEQGIVFTFGAPGVLRDEIAQHSVIGLTLRSSDPPIAAAQYQKLYGFELHGAHRDVATVGVAGALVTLVRERIRHSGEHVLSHMGLFVESAGHALDAARRRGLEVVRVDEGGEGAVHSVFVRGPEQVCLQYVERAAVAVT